jgi:multidrug efflux system membrane fusion protein
MDSDLPEHRRTASSTSTCWRAVLAAALTVGVVACAPDATPPVTPRAGDAPAGGAAAPPPVPVSVASVVQKSMPITIELIGAAEAVSSVAVHAQITGELTSVNFREGDEVNKGQELFTLDRRPLEAALRQVQANLARDVAQLENARAQLQRYEGLTDRGIATREQLDTSRTGVAALDATVAADRAFVENAEVQLAYATIRAPITGRVGKLLVSVGNLVRATDVSPLVVINQISPIYVTFSVPESQLPELNRYRARGAVPIAARPPAELDAPPAQGTLAFLDNTVDASTGTIAARASFPNVDHRLWPGQFVNISVLLDRDPNAIVVPSSALQDSQQGKFAFVVTPAKTVVIRPVHVVRTVGAETVVSDGVQSGDLVVTDGQTRLGPGTHVTVRAQSVGRSS